MPNGTGTVSLSSGTAPNPAMQPAEAEEKETPSSPVVVAMGGNIAVRTCADWTVLQAAGPSLALSLLSAQPNAAAVIAFHDPGCDSVGFLTTVRERYPGAIRILVADPDTLEDPSAAVNKAGVFRWLASGTPTELESVIHDALRIRSLSQAERGLLQTTLISIVNTLTEILALSAPAAFQRAAFARACVHEAVKVLGWTDPWMYEVAAALSQIGRIGVQSSDQTHAEVAFQLLATIPRMESAAQIIRWQDAEPPSLVAHEVRQGISLLRAALTLETLSSEGVTRDKWRARLSRVTPAIPQPIIDSLSNFRAHLSERFPCNVEELKVGWVLDQNVVTSKGLLLLSKDHELTEPVIRTLRELHAKGALEASIRVRAPRPPAE